MGRPAVGRPMDEHGTIKGRSRAEQERMASCPKCRTHAASAYRPNNARRQTPCTARLKRQNANAILPSNRRPDRHLGRPRPARSHPRSQGKLGAAHAVGDGMVVACGTDGRRPFTAAQRSPQPPRAAWDSAPARGGSLANWQSTPHPSQSRSRDDAPDPTDTMGKACAPLRRTRKVSSEVPRT
jgi:hypothetical protein